MTALGDPRDPRSNLGTAEAVGGRGVVTATVEKQSSPNLFLICSLLHFYQNNSLYMQDFISQNVSMEENDNGISNHILIRITANIYGAALGARHCARKHFYCTDFSFAGQIQ